MCTDEEEEEEVEEEEEGEGQQHGHSYFQVSPIRDADLVADVIHGGTALSFVHAADSTYETYVTPPRESRFSGEVPAEGIEESLCSEQFSAKDSLGHEWEEINEESVEEEIPARDSDSVRNSIGSTEVASPSPVMLDRFRNDLPDDAPVYDGGMYFLSVPYEIIVLN